jgi:hypothetical protein
MRYYDIVVIATQQRQLQTEELQKLKDCAAIDCNRRISLPHAQHRHDDVQRTYILQQRSIHHHAKASKPNRIKPNPARNAAIKASVCVSTVIKVKSESNWMQPAGKRHKQCCHGVNQVPCAVHDCDLYSKEVGCR